jgi:hypothetical protein
MMNKYNQSINDILGVTLAGRAMRCNLFVRASQKGFSLVSLTQKTPCYES